VDSNVIEKSTSGAAPRGRASGRIAVKVGNKVFDGPILGNVFEKVLKFLVDENHLKSLPLPWGPTNQRYLITNEPDAMHPTGRPVLYPLKYQSYTMESHYDRERGMQVLKALCEKLKLPFEVITA